MAKIKKMTIKKLHNKIEEQLNQINQLMNTCRQLDINNERLKERNIALLEVLNLAVINTSKLLSDLTNK